VHEVVKYLSQIRTDTDARRIVSVDTRLLVASVGENDRSGGGCGRGPVRVLIAGGGVGALEAALALRHLAEDRVEVTLLCPETEFRYRPASVAVPFGAGQVYRYPLADVAAAAGARLRRGAVAAVVPEEHRLVTDADDVLTYDVLVIAAGARRVPVLSGALAFRGEEDTQAIEQLLHQIVAGAVTRVVFALPRGASWALPLYELALLTAAHVADKRVPAVSLDLVTPEEQPLAQFGGDVSAAVAELLRERHITVHTGVYPVAVYPGRLMLIPHAMLPADRVVCVPAARGVPIAGVPHDEEGFLAVDQLGQVRGIPDVYAVGDITAYPIKQGGVAAQQADLVAQAIARDAGVPLAEPAPLRPVMRGLLITGGRPQYLLADLAGGRGETATSSTEPLWWPGAKIAAHYLGPYLAEARHATDEEP
jgi:sulfide:quinone oxidoreductase